MMNTLSDLNNYLFEEVERLLQDDLGPDEFEKEIQRAGAITKVSETIIRNGELALKTMEHLNEYGYNDALAPVPDMLLARGTENAKKIPARVS